MSEQEMNSFRFRHGAEPSDELLSQLMHEVAIEANELNQAAYSKYHSILLEDIAAAQRFWADRIACLHGN